MHATTPKYHLLQAEKTANIVQLTSYPFSFEKLFIASAGTTNLAGEGVFCNFYTYKGVDFFLFNILNFNILGFFRKINIFGGMNVLWIFLRVITKGVISMHLRVVSKAQGTELGIFFGLVVKFQFFGWRGGGGS